LDLTDEQIDLLGLWACPGVGPATVYALRALAARRGLSLRQAAALHPRELVTAGCPREGVAALARTDSLQEHARRAAEALIARCAAPLLVGHAGYPPRVTSALGRQAPPVISAVGDAGLLSRRPIIAIVGSRRPSAPAGRACREFCRALASAGRVLVSGGARGVDTIAHTAGLEHGSVVVVSPVGLFHFLWRGQGMRPRGYDNWCLLAQFPPWQDWHNNQALMRNCVIVALADAVVAFEPRDRGGTWHSCHRALEMERPLFVVNAADDPARQRGLRKLVRKGAVALQPDHMPSPRELDRLISDYEPRVWAEQTGLFNDGR
jgi:DNA processing protein